MRQEYKANSWQIFFSCLRASMITHNKRSIQLCISTTTKQLFWFCFLGGGDFLFVWVFSPFFFLLKSSCLQQCEGRGKKEENFWENSFPNKHYRNFAPTLQLLDFNTAICREIKQCTKQVKMPISQEKLKTQQKESRVWGMQ